MARLIDAVPSASASRVPSRRGQAWLRLLFCPLLAACCFILFGAGSALGASASATAHAVGAQEAPAPMCDPDGASVAADEVVPEIDRGHFEALPCEEQLMLAGWRLGAFELGCQATSASDRESPVPHPAPAPPVRHEAAGELCVPFPARAEPTSMCLAVCDGLAPRRGHGRPLFRPPVARG